MLDKDRLYYKVLDELLLRRALSLEDSILVICGGHMDRNVLDYYDFHNVVISNLDSKYDRSLTPYKWEYQDAESLTFEDQTFDWVMVHAGLHHCYSPHKAMIEMMRVCSKGILVIEARESQLSLLAKSFGWIATYELEAVIGNDMKVGGVANSQIPNYVYRWTENEIQGIVKSYWPEYSDNKIHYFYNLRIPLQRLKRRKSKMIYYITFGLSLFLRAFNWVFPKQSNEFAFFIEKGGQLQPWLYEVNDLISIDHEYVGEKYSKN